MQNCPLTPCPDLAMASSRHPTQGRIAGGGRLRGDLRQQEDDREKAENLKSRGVKVLITVFHIHAIKNRPISKSKNLRYDRRFRIALSINL